MQKNYLKINFYFVPVYIRMGMLYYLQNITYTFLFSLFCILFFGSLSADVYFTGGPETYFIKRSREGGSFQKGRLDGVKIDIDRIERCRWYFGGEYQYASGDIKGYTAGGNYFVSKLTDTIYEGRLGYTFQQKEGRQPFFVPFGGWGYFKEVNAFRYPSLLTYTFNDTFHFFTIGFLSGVNFTPLLSMGVNFKVRFMIDGTSQVTNDPVYDEVNLNMENEMQIRLDIPFTFNLPCSLFGIAMQLVPFYEFRHFGGREGYPFNFRDTKFYIYGAQLALLYRY